MAAGKSMSNVSLPEWLHELGQSPAQAVNPDIQGVHRKTGSYAPSSKSFRLRSSLPVYRRQLFPDRLLSEEPQYGQTVFETQAVRMWSMPEKAEAGGRTE